MCLLASSRLCTSATASLAKEAGAPVVDGGRGDLVNYLVGPVLRACVRRTLLRAARSLERCQLLLQAGDLHGTEDTRMMAEACHQYGA